MSDDVLKTSSNRVHERDVGDLRVKIAAAIGAFECEDRCGTTFGHRPCPDCLELVLPQADAVIAALELQADMAYLSNDRSLRYIELRGFYSEEVDE